MLRLALSIDLVWITQDVVVMGQIYSRFCSRNTLGDIGRLLRKVRIFVIFSKIRY